jgi:hypothetical protein
MSDEIGETQKQPLDAYGHAYEVAADAADE